MWGQINVLTLVKNDEKRVESSTLHRRQPKAHFVPNILHLHNIVNTKNTHQNQNHQNRGVAFLWNMGTRTQDLWTLRHSHESVPEI